MCWIDSAYSHCPGMKKLATTMALPQFLCTDTYLGFQSAVLLHGKRGASLNYVGSEDCKWSCGLTRCVTKVPGAKCLIHPLPLQVTFSESLPPCGKSCAIGMGPN